MNSQIVSQEYREDLARAGQAIYDMKLKQLMEPAHNNEYVVIHVDTEDYAIGRTFREASQTLQARHPKDGRMIGWKIGPDPDNDFFARMVAGEVRNSQYSRTKE